MRIVAAILTGVGILLAGNLPWGVLAARNFLVWTSVPWAVVPMALYLLAYWRFISGAWGLADTASTRRSYLRARRLSAPMWALAIGAGALGFVALIALLALAARLVRLPASAPIPTPAAMPAATALLLLAMQSIVAGVTEEAAFRGYMQSMIERAHGVAVAILVNGVVFGLLHFGNHPGDVLLMLPYYVAVSAVYGGLTWAADSILPALVLHCAGDVVVLTRWWATGLPEWQVTPTPPALVWHSGVDASFVATAIVAAVLSALVVVAYGAVRRRRVRAGDLVPITDVR